MLSARSGLRRPAATATALLLLGTLALGGCSGLSMPKLGLPKVHRIVIQQGNVITQEMVDRLKPGMTRRQVAYVMGEPVLQDPFNADRWDYVSTVKLPNGNETRRQMTLWFEADRLARFSGDLVPGGGADA